jgi:hypothetical protein
VNELSVQVASVPLYVEQDRPFVDLDLTGTEGQVRRIRCWLDTGGSALFIREEVARELGLTWTPLPEHPNIARVSIPRASIGGFDLDLSGCRTFVRVGTFADPGVKAEGLLGGHLLARYHVIFDYPNRTFTIARPGLLTPRGTPVPTPFCPPMCFPRLEAEIDGERVGLLLDTGATCTMLSTALLSRLADRHPDWPQVKGAAGVANMIGNQDPGLPLMRLPNIACGDVAFSDVLAVGRKPGTFETMMTDMMIGPVIGALAGNALKHFRVEIDYANQTTYFERLTDPDPTEMDLVGIILDSHADGRFTITGTASSCGYPEGAVQPGDHLLAVDGHPVAGLSRPEVLALLKGVPGDLRRLAVERAGRRIEVALPVVRLL